MEEYLEIEEILTAQWPRTYLILRATIAELAGARLPKHRTESMQEPAPKLQDCALVPGGEHAECRQDDVRSTKNYRSEHLYAGQVGDRPKEAVGEFKSAGVDLEGSEIATDSRGM